MKVYKYKISFLIVILSLLLLVGCQKAGETQSSTISETSSEVTSENPDNNSDEENENSSEVQVEEAVVYEPQPVPASIMENGAIAYQIFPIAFADADGNGTGDIQGIIDQLDYLKNELYVDVIWLNPIHPSPSYHKYDVTDYKEIDLSFGNLEIYQTLLDEAHKRDIKVLLDFVINHTSSSHPWFVNAKSGPDSEYRDFYIWSDFKEVEYPSEKGWYAVSGSEEKYFASFWSEMPELNFDNPLVREEIKSIAKYWLDMGVDGFRIDAAKHIYDINEYPKGTPVLEKNLNWFLEFNHFMKEVKPESFLLLETWDSYNSIANYLIGSDSAFNFEIGTSIVSAVVSENRKNIQNKLPKVLKAYDKVTEHYVDSVFLANHDQDRVMSQLGGDVNKAKLAATIQMTLPGMSWIYYGEEIGMSGAKPDEDIREAMKWSANQETLPNSRWRQWKYNNELASLEEQRVDEASMFATYRALAKLKSTDAVIRFGAYVDYEIPTSFRLFSYFREFEGTTYFIIHNLHGEAKTVNLSISETTLIYSSQGSIIDVTGQQLTLAPYGSLIVQVPNTSVTAEEVK